MCFDDGMREIIRAVVIDGFHKGQMVVMEYHPTLKLYKPKTVTVDYCCDFSEYPSSEEILEYRECFRGVDGKVVLYSQKGDSTAVFDLFEQWKYAFRPWGPMTTLYKGFHNEPVLRSDGDEERVPN